MDLNFFGDLSVLNDRIFLEFCFPFEDAAVFVKPIVVCDRVNFVANFLLSTFWLVWVIGPQMF